LTLTRPIRHRALARRGHGGSTARAHHKPAPLGRRGGSVLVRRNIYGVRYAVFLPEMPYIVYTVYCRTDFMTTVYHSAYGKNTVYGATVCTYDMYMPQKVVALPVATCSVRRCYKYSRIAVPILVIRHLWISIRYTVYGIRPECHLL
jgi:hypothetical protein